MPKAFYQVRNGDFSANDKFHKIDHWRNILSNKLCAISRLEPKDMVDILIIGDRKLTGQEKRDIKIAFYKQFGEQKIDLVSYTKADDTGEFKFKGG